jgi:putative hydrolase of the HAD superfamily
MIKAVLFDLDETLLDRTRSLERFLPQHVQRIGLEPDQIEGYVTRFHELDAKGYGPKDVMFATLVSEFDLRQTEPELHRNFTHEAAKGSVLYPDAIPTLLELCKRGFALGIITNGTVAMQQGKLQACQLEPLVDFSLISEREGIKKPDPRIFNTALERLGLPAAQVLFVGDHPQNDVGGAANVGMLTAWLRQGREWPLERISPTFTLKALGDLLELEGVQSVKA